MCKGITLKDVSSLFRSFFLCVFSFTGRKSKHRKDKDEPIAKSDEISPDRTPALPDDDRYLFQHKKRGFAVLIINSKFDGQSRRPYADSDRYYMYMMFQQLDFTVILLENLTSRKLLKKMNGMGFFKVKIYFLLLLIGVKLI